MEILKKLFSVKLVLILAVAVLISAPAFNITYAAPQQTKLLVIPFKVNAMEDYTYFEQSIPEMIQRNLHQDGIQVVVAGRDTVSMWGDFSAQGIENARRLAQKLGAQAVLWGSITFVGDSYSLDARLLRTANQTPRVFSEAGQGLLTIPDKIDILSQEAAMAVVSGKRVNNIIIEGNKRIEKDAILGVMATKPGDPFINDKVSNDIKAIYAMGYFDQITVSNHPNGGGEDIVITVQEKPIVRNIRVSGSLWLYDKEDILDAVNTKKGAILNVFTVQGDVAAIKEMYNSRNRYNTTVDYRITDNDGSMADVEFVVEEGKKLYVTKIIFEGNKYFDNGDLEGEIFTRTKGWFSWLTDSGDLNYEKLANDVNLLTGFYANNGFLDTRVGEPEVIFEENGITVIFLIDEGPQYMLSGVTFTGDLIEDKEKLLKQMVVTNEKHFSRELVQQDILAINDIYGNAGYAYVDVSPLLDYGDNNTVYLTYDINKGPLVYFEQINISGNQATRDKVIRRELKSFEGEVFSAENLKYGVRSIQQLDYFSDVKINTAPGSAEDTMILDIDVTEKDTGAFSVGVGAGTEEVFGSVSLVERNLFGHGQTLGARANIGTKNQMYSISFIEPWLFDIPLMASLEIYDWEYEYDTYDRSSYGFNMDFSYPIFDYTRVGVGYNLDFANISNLDYDASYQIWRDRGKHTKSAFSAFIRRDSRDDRFNTTEGSINSFSLEFAGFGGDVGFVKGIVESGWYFPLFKHFVFVAHGKMGVVTDSFSKDLPDYEKFYIGGMNSLRGFKTEDLAPRDMNGYEMGGEKYVQFNLEFKFPLLSEQGVSGLWFLDGGDVYEKYDDWDSPNGFRYSTGPELRWNSPMGPVRIAYGFILNKKDSDKRGGNFEFSMYSSF